MYGISNSQQQGGGGGGGAASYKAIKSTIAPSDWQEVAKQPYFVGSNAMEWATTSGIKTKSQGTNIGLVGGNNYTITIVADGQTYTATVTSEAYSGLVSLDFAITNDIEVVIYDGVNVSTMEPGTGSMCMVMAGAMTSLIITSFVGEGLAKTIQATIPDSAIKVNSAVTMYTNTREKISVGTKTNGNVTLIAPSIPTSVLIPYSLEIVGTDTEGLFEIINGYVPEITLPTVPQWHTIYEDTTGTGVTSIDNLTESLKGGELYRITIEGDFYIFCLHHDGDNVVREENIVVEQLNAGNNSLTHNTMSLVYHEHSLSLAYELYYDITETGISNYDFSTAPGIKFTKLEVYR